MASSVLIVCTLALLAAAAAVQTSCVEKMIGDRGIPFQTQPITVPPGYYRIHFDDYCQPSGHEVGALVQACSSIMLPELDIIDFNDATVFSKYGATVYVTLYCEVHKPPLLSYESSPALEPRDG